MGRTVPTSTQLTTDNSPFEKKKLFHRENSKTESMYAKFDRLVAERERGRRRAARGGETGGVDETVRARFSRRCPRTCATTRTFCGPSRTRVFVAFNRRWASPGLGKRISG